jgi:DNA polymerase beta
MSQKSKITLKTNSNTSSKTKLSLKPKSTSKPKVTLKAKQTTKDAKSKPGSKLKDLRQIESKVSDSVTNLNQELTDVLEKLVEQIKDDNRKETDRKIKTSNNFRLKQLKQAIETIRNHPEEIESGEEAMKLKGIGKGIAKRIDTIFETGTLPDELRDDNTEVDEEVEAVRDLTTVTGIGEVHALNFYKKFGVKSVSDLQNKFKKGEIELTKNQLTHHMVIGLKYYDDFNIRIPRNEITASKKLLDQAVAFLAKKYKGLEYLICGSYRRGLETSGDMDVLLTTPMYQTYRDLHGPKIRLLSELVEYLVEQGFLIDHLTQDITTKYMGVCRIRELARRIDIRVVAHESWAPAMLYFTGSGAFNVRMRNVALSQGMTLNEYGLYPLKEGEKGTAVKVKSEEDIFAELGLLYLEPKERF